MPVYLDRAQMTMASAPGTGTATLSAASSSYQTIAAAGGVTGDVYRSLWLDGTAWEISSGVYNSSGPTLTRVLESSSTGSLLNLSANATVTVIEAASDIRQTAVPQGRLTLQSGAPVMTADQLAKSTVYYDSFRGNLTPVYNGTRDVFLAITGDEISMGLDAVTPHVAVNNNYDVFGINNAGSLVIAVGPAWINTATVTMTLANPAVITWTNHGLIEGAPVVFTNSGGALPSHVVSGTTYFVGKSPGASTFNIASSIANAAAGTYISTNGDTQSGTHTGTNHTSTRGTGAGTTEIQLLNGVWRNKNALTHAWGGASGTTDYGTVAANCGTYLGSIYGTANGQTGMPFKPVATLNGPGNILGLYNAYNRVMIKSYSMDSTTSWSYAVNAFRAANGSVTNRISFIDGLRQSPISAVYNILLNTFGLTGIGLNTTANVPAGITGQGANQVVAQESFLPVLGFNYVQAMESAPTSTTYFGVQSSNRQLNALSVELEM